MIDLTTEQPLRLHEIAKLAGTGRGGRPINISTVWRWVLKGCKAPDGTIVRLESLKVGAHFVSSAEALQRFCEAITPRFDSEQRSPSHTPARRRRQAEKAAKALDKAGL